ncbi:D-2-hydroxyacid dehydrogenase [Hymenobacter jejuensis]|uniref:D-2-hydroxyacid dehydrogenase n=1 Tax=Hymenobacter jejuensis TaxID=2502781 RepID=A0A5B7ZU66_9BACT|nr:D-2-hydroxyacid dehydrogenase [Hymenobacter jejuensis]QDA58721.1 D-2-hydroxyacid dehydrogenase [Hymenobacter jejuensis]
MRLFVYSAFSEARRNHLRQELAAEGITAIFRNELPEEEQQAAFQSANLLLGNPPMAWFADGAPKGLIFWQIDSAGFERYRHLHLPIAVANMGDFFAWPCAETIVAGILGLYRHLNELAVLQAQQHWVGTPIRAKLNLLRGKRVVILGAGAIGQAVREQLSGFRCEVQLLARHNPQAHLHSKEELQNALPHIDLIINCLPGSAENFFSAELVAAMAAGSVYASVGRGNTTDETALLAALQAGQLGGAVLDVTATEPLPIDSPLWRLPNVILTQHTAGGQPYEDEGRIAILRRNLHHFRHGEPLENPVELARGY